MHPPLCVTIESEVSLWCADRELFAIDKSPGNNGEFPLRAYGRLGPLCPLGSWLFLRLLALLLIFKINFKCVGFFVFVYYSGFVNDILLVGCVANI